MKAAEYMKRPVVIEAVQTQGLPFDSQIVDWILANGGTARWHDDGRIAIDTLEGTMLADPSDWIIRGIEGEFYPVKAGIFEATYEPL